MRQRRAVIEGRRTTWRARPGSWVRVSGRQGIYVVLYLDEARGIADLLVMDPVRSIESGISIDRLQEMERRS